MAEPHKGHLHFLSVFWKEITTCLGCCYPARDSLLSLPSGQETRKDNDTGQAKQY
jgi:hypothetical protein